MKQMRFGFLGDYSKEFGGSLLTGKRKSKRPLSVKNPMHLVLKTTGKRFFSPGNRSLEKQIGNVAAKFKIKVSRVSLNWSHIHAIIQVPNREAYNSFVRELTSKISIAISKRFGLLSNDLFDLRPYTRILNWGCDLANVYEYHDLNDLNDLEARGYIQRSRKKPFGHAPQREKAIKNS